MTRIIKSALRAAAAVAVAALASTTAASAADPAYFSEFQSLRMSRDAAGILLVEMNTNGGPITFTAKDHEQFVDAFYKIGRDRANKVVILTGAGGDWMSSIDFSTFGDVGDADIWAKTHDEGVQILENIANIRVPMLCAVEGRAWIHSEYCLLANVIVAGAGATFSDTPHFAGGIVPGDGIYTTWSHFAGHGRAQQWLMDPKPISAATAKDWGVVGEIAADGGAVARAREIATGWLDKRPHLTLRNTRIHFMQPLKERLLKEVGYGLSLEGASASALVKQLSAGAKK